MLAGEFRQGNSDRGVLKHQIPDVLRWEITIVSAGFFALPRGHQKCVRTSEEWGRGSETLTRTVSKS